MFLIKANNLVLSIPLLPKHMKEDLTEYVTETLHWAMGRMTELTLDNKGDDALAIGAEFIDWANENDKDIICCSLR